jgi:hypothetical protein
MNVRIHDLRHQELVLRYVVGNTEKEMVTENVIGYKPVHDQNRRGRKYFLSVTLNEFGPNISNCRGQGYNNWENMKDKYYGQTRPN